MTITKLSETIITEILENKIEYLKTYILNSNVIKLNDFKNENFQRTVESYISRYLENTLLKITSITKPLIKVSNVTTAADAKIGELIFDIYIIEHNKHIYITIKK